MSRKALVEDSTGLVVNVIEIEDSSNWPIPNGHFLIVATDKGGTGDTWNGSDFIIPEPEPLDPSDIRLNVLEDKARKDQTMTIAELREMYKLKHLR